MEITYHSNNVRDENGKWLNSNVFREEAIKYMETKNYCNDPKGSPSYMEYWGEQLERCIVGYEVDGHKITGHHYSYLNFTEIAIVEGDEGGESTAAKKVIKNPDFWDGDYDYYWAIEIAKNGLFSKEALATSKEEKEWYKTLTENADKYKAKQDVLNRLKLKVIPHPDHLDGGRHIIVGKSRRKGYSYKNAAICANVYNTVRNSLTLIGAFDKKFLYPKGTMGMASSYLDYINKTTAWGKAREKVDKQEHRRASFEETIDGITSEVGYKSDIIAISFGDNPDVARGKDALYILFEEAGAFPNLEASYKATQPGLTAGKYITGQMLVFGTGGDMESGTVDFANMFYNPIEFQLMPFLNIWDENAEGTYCGFFHPMYMNYEGFYDEMGNSDIQGAIDYEKEFRRNLVKASTSTGVIQSRVQEYPLCPSEAFLTVSTNDFPIVELREQFNRVVRENLHLKLGQPCFLMRTEEGKVIAKPDLEGLVEPIWDYKPKTKEYKGGVVIYEYPMHEPPKGLYTIGFDPYMQAQSESSSLPSFASIYVYKGVYRGSGTKNQIVAQYVGRPYSPDDVNRIAELLAELYGAEIMYENMVTHVKAYFERRKKLNLLALQPDSVISAAIKNSKVSRVYGIHMNEKLKDAGEKYIKQWLLEERDVDENGKVILNLHTIYDPALLEELILYNRKGNFDRVMSFMMVMFALAEEEENKIYGDSTTITQLKEEFDGLLPKLFRKN